MPEITFVPNVTEGTAHWRCFTPAKALGAKVVDPKDCLDYSNWTVVGMEGSVCVWQHVQQWDALAIMAKQVADGVKVFVDVDDNYLRKPPNHVPSVWGKEQYAIHKEAIQLAHGVLASSEALAETYRRELGTTTPVFFCPNCIDPSAYPDTAVRAKFDGIYRIGFAGSHSHRAGDLRLVSRALSAASKCPDVEIVCFGTWRSDWKFPFVRVGGVPLAEYREYLTVLDVGLAPLVVDEWTICKTHIKAMEYAMAGVLPIVQDCEVFKYWDWLYPFKLMCKTPRDYMKAVLYAVDHQEEAKTIARLCKDFVLANWVIYDNVHYWREAFDAA